MSFFKNDKMVKKEEIKVDTTPVIEAIVEIDNRDSQIAEQKTLIAEAIELFSKILKGYPVNDKVKVWVEKASKEL